MSLDVSLTLEDNSNLKFSSSIYIRENGLNREIALSENGGTNAFQIKSRLLLDKYLFDSNEVYAANITHNLNTMADKANLYKPLWRPEELDITKAHQLIEPLSAGLSLLKSNPAYFTRFNPSNGWGDYDGLVSFVEGYLKACEQYPEAEVEVSR